ncbi:MAG: glycine cleavage system aminomethyltransferase GcvT [Candidatus Heimdallarchaeota archaeon]
MKKPQLYDWHKKHAEMTEFVGWDMPIQYKGIINEHMTVREGVGLFDISHMGRCYVSGEGSTHFLDSVLPRDISVLVDGQAAYTFALNEYGGFRDDLVVIKNEPDNYLVVYNAVNRAKIATWFSELIQFSKNFAVTNLNFVDIGDNSAMFALQGPLAEKTLQKLINTPIPHRWRTTMSEISNTTVLISRTGYTGEDGFEIIVFETTFQNSENALVVWNSLLEAGEGYHIQPCGLGARNTLRLEAGMSLYGQDIHENVTPFEARLAFIPFFKLNKETYFIGKNALRAKAKTQPERLRVGFELIEKGIPRHGYELAHKGEKIGEVTSGTFSPILNRGIGMGYVQTKYSEPGTKLSVVIRGNLIGCKIREWPFYDKNRYGYTRK